MKIAIAWIAVMGLILWLETRLSHEMTGLVAPLLNNINQIGR